MVANCLEQQLPIDAVKIALDVNIEHPVEPPAALSGLLEGVDRRSAGAVSIGVIVEDGELLRNLGDGRVQAASGCWLTASMPSMNFVPVISFGNWLWPSRRRQLFSAACASLKIMAIAVLFERHPLERTVRCRTVANVLSMGLVVRRCFQCSAGKS